MKGTQEDLKPFWRVMQVKDSVSQHNGNQTKEFAEVRCSEEEYQSELAEVRSSEEKYQSELAEVSSFISFYVSQSEQTAAWEKQVSFLYSA